MLNAWLVDGATRREAGLSKEKKRSEMFSQVRALLRVSKAILIAAVVAMGIDFLWLFAIASDS